MSNRAWVTLATNDSYSLGALVLAHSLRRVGSTYPAVILITPSVTDAMRERLRAVFADVIVVDVLDSRDATHLALLQRPELGITFTKIHCWSLTQFEKCIFLDADTLVVQNCDELFEREELSAAPDVGWPDCFNSGVFVYRPSQATFDALIQFAKQRGSFDGGDQGLLNSYFSSWAHGDINKHLPFLYNVTSAAFYSYLPALKHFGQDLKIIHFIGAAKPWLQTYNWESHSVDSAGHLKDTLQLWWEIFVSSVHRQLDVTMTGVAGNLARVVPGAISSQREALDELTRRQGWEAGNIDYLGADSFDNIWAKISQTLNQSPKQPSPPKEAVPVLKDPTPPKETTPAPKQPSPPKQLPAKPPTPPKEQPIKDPSPVKQPSPPKEEPVAAEPIVEEIPATVEAVLAESVPTEARTVAPVEIIPAAAEPPKQESAIPAVTEKAKNEPVMPATPPVTPSDTASTTPVTETAPVVETPAPVVEKPDLVEVPKIPELDLLEASQSDKEVTPKKTLELSTTSTDSPPLANTPSKEEITTQQAAKSEGEKARKPTGKLQLSPPVATDPLPTPDSEVEDAASLAQSIIASELATPTVTSPTPPAPLTPASPPPALQQKRLSVDEPLPATPPAGPVSLAQIGVKPKPSIASQIESSITDKVETATPPETPTTPTSPSEPGTPTEVPKKKMVKKSVKKEAVTVAGAETPVPPPRKKEKKPKDK